MTWWQTSKTYAKRRGQLQRTISISKWQGILQISRCFLVRICNNQCLDRKQPIVANSWPPRNNSVQRLLKKVGQLHRMWNQRMRLPRSNNCKDRVDQSPAKSGFLLFKALINLMLHKDLCPIQRPTTFLQKLRGKTIKDSSSLS